MRSSLVNILLFVFMYQALVPAALKHELVHLPNLVQHYWEHKSEQPEITIREFVQLHYGGQFAQHQSDHDHQNLPGKHQHTQFNFYLVHSDVELVAMHPLSVFSFSLPLRYKDVFSAHATLSPVFSCKIWQPPKLA
jgi:hypothetical protein